MPAALHSKSLYRARFENTVSGLLKGSAVLFNGIRVGEIVDLQLNPENPKQVTAIMSVDRETPVRSDTKVGIEFQGLMGAPVLSLNGGASNASPIVPTDNQPPLLSADPDAGQNMTEAARGVLRHIDDVVNDNAEPLRTLIANINTFSGCACPQLGSRRRHSLRAGENDRRRNPKVYAPTSLISKQYKTFRPWPKFQQASWSFLSPTLLAICLQ